MSGTPSANINYGEISSSEDDLYNMEPRVEINVHNTGDRIHETGCVKDSSEVAKDPKPPIGNGVSGLREVVVVDSLGNRRKVLVSDGTNEPEVTPHNIYLRDFDLLKMKQQNPNKGVFPCPHCDHVSTWKKSLRRHILVIHKNHKPFQCDHCDYAASERVILDRHVINTHKRTEIKPYKCSVCSYSAVEKGKVKRHITSVHDGVRPHKCPQCSFSAIDRTRLKRHVASVHEGSKPYRCPHCVHSTSEKGNLKTHIMSVHMQLKPFSCPICSYNSSEKGTLNRHIRTVHRDMVQGKAITT